MLIRRYILYIAICMCACSPLHADEAKFQASLDRNAIAIGESAQLGLTFYGTQSMPAPDIDRIDGLEIRYLGPSTMMTVINGQMSSSITHMYSVQPLRTGSFQLGPFRFQHRNISYVSNMVVLEVAEERAPSAPPTRQPVVEKIDLGDRMFLTLEAERLTGYVNELIPITVRLYVNRMNVSDIQLPTFEQEEFSKVAFKEPRQYRQAMNGILYDILEFKTNIFGTKAGDYTLGPAKIKCNVMLRKKLPRAGGMSDDFFGDEFGRDSFFDDFYTRYERHPVELKSDPVKLVVLPLPAQGMPKDFAGSIGDYQFILSASPTKVKVGDPITLNMSINGKGNFNTVIIPKIESAEGFRVYEPQIKTGENTKEFKQVLIPETDTVKSIPALSFSYFNPYKKEYKTITQGPIGIEVEKGKEEAPAQVFGPVPSAASPAEPDEAVRDIVSIKKAPGRFTPKGQRAYRSPLMAAGFILPPVCLAILAAVLRRRNRIKTDSAYAGRIAAFRLHRRAVRNLRKELRRKGCGAFCELLFKTIQDYFGNRLNIPTAGITFDVIEQAVAGKDVDPDIMRKIRSLITECDRAKFAQAEVDEMRVEDGLRELHEVIDYFERKRL